MSVNGLSYIIKFYSLSRLALVVLLILLVCTILYYIIRLGNKHLEHNQRLKFGYRFRVLLYFVFCIALLVYLVIKYNILVMTIIKLLLWSLVFAYLLNPFVNIISRRNISRGMATIIVFACIVIAIVVLALTITPIISKQISEFTELLPQYTEEFMDIVDRFYNAYIVQVNNLPKELLGFDIAIDNYMQGLQTKSISIVQKITDRSLDFFANLIIIVMVPIFIFYFLKDAEYFKRKVLMIIPKSIRNESISAGRDINRVLNQYVRGQLLVALIVGVVSVITLMMMGVDFALIVGMLAGIMNIIPYFGPIFGAIPAMLVAMIDNPIKAIWVGIAFFIIQQVESALLQPKISGDSVNLHPVIILIALLIGSELFGIAGLVFAVPVAGSLKIIILHVKKLFVKI